MTDRVRFSEKTSQPGMQVSLDVSQACALFGLNESDLDPATRAAIAAMASEITDLRTEVATLELALEQAQSLADHDALVPVFNKRAFRRELSRALSFCTRYGADAGLIYLDLDGFKALNDRLGHAAGDDALQRIGQTLIANTRESDIIGRLGGDEFALLLLHADMETVEAKANDIRKQIMSIRLAGQSSASGLDASCGCVCWVPGESVDAFVSRADEAMYAAKLEKRDSTERADAAPMGAHPQR